MNPYSVTTLMVLRCVFYLNETGQAVDEEEVCNMLAANYGLNDDQIAEALDLAEEEGAIDFGRITIQ